MNGENIKTLFQFYLIHTGPLKLFVFSIMMLLIGTACNASRPTAPLPPSSTSTSTNRLALMAKADLLSVWATEADRQTALDILVAIQSNAVHICSELQTECQFEVTVEVYADQSAFDEYVMNPSMRGFFAISGEGNRIQMVSPAHPAPHDINYEDGVLIAVHEFAHLALDEINPEIPTWLDEGTAIYLGSHTPYTTVCQYVFPFDMVPSFDEFTHHYDDIQAPDLFAYTAVDFIVSEFGIEKLNLLLRGPDDLEKVLGISRTTFEEAWHQFMRTHYHSNKL